MKKSAFFDYFFSCFFSTAFSVPCLLLFSIIWQKYVLLKIACFLAQKLEKNKKKTSLELKQLVITIHIDSSVSTRNLKCPSLARLGSERSQLGSARAGKFRDHHQKRAPAPIHWSSRCLSQIGILPFLLISIKSFSCSFSKEQLSQVTTMWQDKTMITNRYAMNYVTFLLTCWKC